MITLPRQGFVYFECHISIKPANEIVNWRVTEIDAVQVKPGAVSTYP